MTDAYVTTSIPEAAFLMSRGYPLLGIEPTAHDPRVRQFVFDETAASDAPHYHDGTHVGARVFYKNLSDLKAALFPRVFRRGGDANHTPRSLPHHASLRDTPA